MSPSSSFGGFFSIASSSRTSACDTTGWRSLANAAAALRTASTRHGGAIASAWAVMHYLGIEGYRAKARVVTDPREKLMRGIEASEGLRNFGDPKLALFSYGADDIDIFAVWQRLLGRDIEARRVDSAVLDRSREGESVVNLAAGDVDEDRG